MMALLWKDDVKAFNDLAPKFNANIDWAGANCVAMPDAAKPKPVEPAPQEKSFFGKLNPF